jgi:transaldolase
VLYVSELIGPDGVNTMPEQTLRAFADHGEATRTLDSDREGAERTLAEARGAGIDLATVTAALEREGVESFCASYNELLECIHSKLEAVVDANG